jgi:SAM-dependent methyltransferase
MKYSDITINDPNPIKRFIQKRRFVDALSLFPTHINPNVILDFGGGNGQLSLQLLNKFSDKKIICYEPVPILMKEAEDNLKGKGGIRLIDSIKKITAASVDLVYCLEVLEHLPENETQKVISDIYSILKNNGVAIFGVPNELYFAALYKGIFRIMRRYGKFDACIKNVLKCIIGRPPEERPVGEIARGLAYHFYHLGYDYRCLPSLLAGRFKILDCIPSPIRILGCYINPEIYYIVQK